MRLRQPSQIRFANDKLRLQYQLLEKGDGFERDLKEWIDHALQELENNAFSGIQIPKRLMPSTYGMPNLWKFNLPHGWRLLYSIASSEIVLVSLILDWMDHKNYERRFKY